MAESELRPYRVVLRSGLETTLLLSEETAERDYPTAREVKVTPVETKAPRRKSPAHRKTETKD